ncbi:MAG TPA: insulinase family protein [Oligoflexia bacterium]|nr:insulinase family protein [Oligoflexia bacterium]HMP48035.1 insulinase family protein [Oligoflexia bacterium]
MASDIAVERSVRDMIYPRRSYSDLWEISLLKISNGVTALIQKNHNRNTVVAQCHWRFSYQRIIDAEIAHVLEHLLLRRRREKSERALKRNIDSLGDITAWVLDERIGIGADVPVEYWHRVIPMMRKLVFLGDITQDELDNEVKIIRTELREDASRVGAYAVKLLYRRCLPRSPASSIAGGFIQNYSKIWLDDLLEFSERNFTASNLVIGVSGDIKTGRIQQQIVQSFGGLKSTGTEPSTQLNCKFRKGITISTRKSSELCGVALAHLIDTRYVPQEVISLFQVLTSSLWSSPLFNAVRTEGAYGCNIWHDQRANNDFICVSFAARPDSVKGILRGYFNLLNRLKSRGPSDSEITLAKKHIRTQAVIRASNIRERTMDLCEDVLNRGSVMPFSEWIKRIMAVDHNLLRKSLKEMLHPQGGHLVIHGNTRGFRSDKGLDQFIWQNEKR